MYSFKKNIDSIIISDSHFVIDLKGKTKNFEVSFEEIKNLYLGFKKVSDLYFFDLISFFLVMGSLALAYWYSLSNLFIGGVVVISFLRAFYLFYNATYFVTVKLKDGSSFNFYFSNDKKNNIIEKIKIIRGKITVINFNVDKGNIKISKL